MRAKGLLERIFTVGVSFRLGQLVVLFTRHDLNESNEGLLHSVPGQFGDFDKHVRAGPFRRLLLVAKFKRPRRLAESTCHISQHSRIDMECFGIDDVEGQSHQLPVVENSPVAWIGLSSEAKLEMTLAISIRDHLLAFFEINLKFAGGFSVCSRPAGREKPWWSLFRQEIDNTLADYMSPDRDWWRAGNLRHNQKGECEQHRGAEQQRTHITLSSTRLSKFSVPEFRRDGPRRNTEQRQHRNDQKGHLANLIGEPEADVNRIGGKA